MRKGFIYPDTSGHPISEETEEKTVVGATFTSLQ